MTEISQKHKLHQVRAETNVGFKTPIKHQSRYIVLVKEIFENYIYIYKRNYEQWTKTLYWEVRQWTILYSETFYEYTYLIQN